MIVIIFQWLLVAHPAVVVIIVGISVEISPCLHFFILVGCYDRLETVDQLCYYLTSGKQHSLSLNFPDIGHLYYTHFGWLLVNLGYSFLVDVYYLLVIVGSYFS